MKRIITLLHCIIIVLFLFSCSTTKKSQTEQSVVNIEFNADSAYAFCAAQCSFGPRTMNSEAHELCSEWIQQKFSQYGYQVELQKADLKGRPWADNDPDEANHRKPVMAANDGASGVAVMLELARLLQQYDSASLAVDFICFDAEDWGIPQWEEEYDGDSWALGAQYWAANCQKQTADSYQYAILLDMVGGQGAKFYREAYSMRYARNIVERVWQAANTAGYGSIFPYLDSGGVTDDHVPVNEKAGIPCIDIINHYPDCEQSSFGPTWHTINDDMQHIDKNTLKAVGQTLVQLIFSE